MYPEGMNKSATRDELNISFDPSPNCMNLAKAAAGSSFENDGKNDWMHGVRVKTVEELRSQLEQVVSIVQKKGRGFLLEALMERRK